MKTLGLRKSRLRRILMIGLFSSLLGCSGLLVIEMILRIFFPMYLTGGYIGNYVYDEEVGYRLKKGYFTELTDYKQEVMVNSFGTINFTNDFTEFSNTIFTLGDSYTQGVGIPMDASYPAQLNLFLNINNYNISEPNFAVINLGLAAYGGKQNLAIYERYKDKLGKPDILLYLGCENDETDDLLFASGYRHRALVENSPVYGVLQKPLAYLTHKTEIGKRLNFLRGNLARRKVDIQEPPDFALKKSEFKGHTSVAEKQQDIFNWLLEETKRNDIFFVVGWANYLKTEKNCNSYEWLKKWAEKNDVAFADWHPYVCNLVHFRPNLPLTNDHSGGHYRVWVNTVIALEFYKHICRHHRNKTIIDLKY